MGMKNYFWDVSVNYWKSGILDRLIPHRYQAAYEDFKALMLKISPKLRLMPVQVRKDYLKKLQFRAEYVLQNNPEKALECSRQAFAVIEKYVPNYREKFIDFFRKHGSLSPTWTHGMLAS